MSNSGFRYYIPQYHNTVHVQPIHILPHSIASKPRGSFFLQRLIGIRVPNLGLGSTVRAFWISGASFIRKNHETSSVTSCPTPSPILPFPLPSLLTVNELELPFLLYAFSFLFPFCPRVAQLDALRKKVSSSSTQSHKEK